MHAELPGLANRDLGFRVWVGYQFRGYVIPGGGLCVGLKGNNPII